MSKLTPCHDCGKDLAAGAPRVVYAEKDSKGVTTGHYFYVCGDCEYRRAMRAAS